VIRRKEQQCKRNIRKTDISGHRRLRLNFNTWANYSLYFGHAEETLKIRDVLMESKACRQRKLDTVAQGAGRKVDHGASHRKAAKRQLRDT